MPLGDSLQDGRVWGAAVGTAALLIGVIAVGLMLDRRERLRSRQVRHAQEPEQGGWIDRVPPSAVVAITVLGASAFVGLLVLVTAWSFDRT